MLELKDIEAIAKLHIDYLSLSFPKNDYYYNLLKIYYSALLNSKTNFCLVGCVEGDVVGYICFVNSFVNIYKQILKGMKRELFSNIIKCVFYYAVDYLFFLKRQSLLFFRNLYIEEMGFRRFIIYELRPMVVAKTYQGTSMASTLIKAAEKILLAKGEKRYFLRVKKDNIRAINFYLKVGCAFSNQKDTEHFFMEKNLS